MKISTVNFCFVKTINIGSGDITKNMAHFPSFITNMICEDTSLTLRSQWAYNSFKHHWSESNLGSSGEFYSRYSGREHLFSIMLYYYVLDTEFQAEHLHCLSLACRRIKYPSL